MNNLEATRILRVKPFLVEARPGVYRWWFPAEQAKQLLGVFSMPINTDYVMKHSIDGMEYWALYCGISVNLHNRVKQHLKGPFTNSTLRRTIRTLICPNSSNAETLVSKFLDFCFWEWKYTDSRQSAKDIEDEELSQCTYCYPLNIDDNKSALIPEGWIEELSRKRK